VWAVVPPDKRIYGGARAPLRGFPRQHDLSSYLTPAVGVPCAIPADEPQLFDIDDFVDERGRRHRIAGDDLGPTYRLIITEDGRVAAIPDNPVTFWLDWVRAGVRKKLDEIRSHH